MSRYFSSKYGTLTPYTPGEQPANVNRLIKLNTNESPFAPSEKAVAYAREHCRSLNLYSDPTVKALSELMAKHLGVEPDELMFTNGSDDILNFAFMAFSDETHPAAFPDITYGFYPVFAALNHVPYEEIPLREDFSVDVECFVGIGRNIFIANPNAPTGMLLTVEEIERIVASNPDNVVVIDEAYIDFGGESCVGLIHKYDNLLVTQTFSKSRSMAGARLGFGVGSKALIRDLNTLRYSTNPYNINSMTIAMGMGILEDQETIDANCCTIIENRAYANKRLRELGMITTNSYANFVFAKAPGIDGGELYRKLKELGILVRHFDKPRINDYLRITVGTREQMDAMLDVLQEILEENK